MWVVRHSCNACHLCPHISRILQILTLKPGYRHIYTSTHLHIYITPRNPQHCNWQWKEGCVLSCVEIPKKCCCYYQSKDFHLIFNIIKYFQCQCLQMGYSNTFEMLMLWCSISVMTACSLTQNWNENGWKYSKSEKFSLKVMWTWTVWKMSLSSIFLKLGWPLNQNF